MKCKWSGCDKDSRPRSPFCGDTCYKRWVRANSDKINPDKPKSDTKVRQAVHGMKVYNRPAVSCDEFNTRPAPLEVTDTPVPHKRGRYTREDGSVYQFDCTGRVCVKSGPVDSVRTASIEDYHAHREDYAERACAELLNWGPWMNTSELKEARLSGNRGTLPGDWDYV